MMMDDLGLYSAGEACPAHWTTVSQRPGFPPMITSNPLMTFALDTEVSFRDGWLRLHALNRHADGRSHILSIAQLHYACLHFNFDMRLFDCDGEQITQIQCAPGIEIDFDDDWRHRYG